MARQNVQRLNGKRNMARKKCTCKWQDKSV